MMVVVLVEKFGMEFTKLDQPKREFCAFVISAKVVPYTIFGRWCICTFDYIFIQIYLKELLLFSYAGTCVCVYVCCVRAVFVQFIRLFFFKKKKERCIFIMLCVFVNLLHILRVKSSMSGYLYYAKVIYFHFKKKACNFFRMEKKKQCSVLGISRNRIRCTFFHFYSIVRCYFNRFI